MKRYEDARDFAGADWQNLKQSSRERLLKANGQREVFVGHTWQQLPPTVKQALVAPLMEEPKVGCYA